MSDVVEFFVPVPGASLRCERRGRGPLVLMIPGGGGDGGYFSQISECLADAFDLVSYDRRGNSRSPLDGDPYPARMDEQCDDALAVIEACGHDRALVFGNSAGAVIGLHLAIRHPGAVTGLIAHEPGSVELLPDRQRWLDLVDEVYAQSKREGAAAAFATFAAEIGQPDEPNRDPELLARLAGNHEFLVEYELRELIREEIDVEALRSSGVPVVLAGGEDSRGRFYFRPGEELARRLGARFAIFPGHHNAYLDVPEEFAAVLRDELERLRAAPVG